MKKSALFFLCFILAFSQLFLSSCSAPAAKEEEAPSPFTYERRDETGYFSFSLYPLGADGKAIGDADLEKYCTEALSLFDETYYSLSPLNPSSDISKINSNVSRVLGIDPSVCEAIGEAFALSDSTGGLYAPASGAAFELLSSEREASEEELANASALSGCDKFTFSEDSCEKANAGAKLYFDTFARARAFEAALHYLKEADISFGILSLDGLVGVFGEKEGGEAFLIDVLSPDSKKVIGTFSLKEGYLCVSHENFPPLADISLNGEAEKGALCAAYSTDAVTCSVISHIGYANGFDSITPLSGEELSFEAIYAEGGTVLKTEDLTDGLFTEPLPEESASEK